MKKLNYSILVLLITLVFTFLITTYGKISTDNEISYTSSANAYEVDDICVDAFIRAYASEILKTNNYEITAENRDHIRDLIAAMGNINIKKLKSAIYSGSAEKITKEVILFVSENFQYEEKALMEQYILNH